MSQTQWENLASWVSIAVAGTVGLLDVLRRLMSRKERHGRFSDHVLGTEFMVAEATMPLNRVEHALAALASRVILCLVLIPAISFTINLTVALRHGIPRPLIHDEFSYLLAADTFSHGRVTNPTPPMWEHFETPHELMRPTYMSKYPPGQGIALAIGQIATGEPIVGVWLSTAAACAAIYWMLLAFVPARWALLGGIVAVLCPELIDWSRVYWGGSVAVLGAAMLIGAWGRLMNRPSVAASIALSVALVILANSRPYEGLVLSAPLLIALLMAAIKRPRAWIGPVVVPAGIVILIALLAMGLFNYRVTGNVLRMPFAEYARQYDVYPKFWFLPTHQTPTYRNDAMRWVHTVFEKGQYGSLRTPGGLVRISADRLGELIWWSAKPAVLMLPLVIGFAGFRDVRLRWLSAAMGLLLLGLLAENFLLPHYAAPVIPIVLLLVIAGWQRIAVWRWRGRAVGRVIVMATVIGFLTGAIMIIEQPVSRDSMIMGHAAMAEVEQLRAGRQLIFVRYAPGNAFHNEYVFNDADIAASRIVWARSLGPEADKLLITAFPGRTVWQLSVGDGLNLDPYRP